MTANGPAARLLFDRCTFSDNIVPSVSDGSAGDHIIAVGNYGIICGTDYGNTFDPTRGNFNGVDALGEEICPSSIVLR